MRTRVLLLLDLISEYRFPDGRRVLRNLRPVLPPLMRLLASARAARRPVIYVNDIAGDWSLDRRAFLARCLDESAPGHTTVRMIEPRPAEHFLFKPRHSAFYQTSLEELLGDVGAEELVVAGVSSHQCVLFTAIDAHVRGFRLIAPRDCMAGPSVQDTRHALYVLEHGVQARTPLARSVRFK